MYRNHLQYIRAHSSNRKSPPDGLRDIARGEVGIVLLGHPGVGA